MSAQLPPFLQRGQRVAIVSTARKVTAEELAPAVQALTSWGLDVTLGESVGSAHHQFAGDDELRRRDFQRQLDDDGVRAILCARGGYGTARFVDELDFTAFQAHPKWVAGFSDITVLNCHLLQLGVASIHGLMPFQFGHSDTHLALETLRRALFGEGLVQTAPTHPLNRPGTATSEVVGGNLSLLHTITGTASQVSFAGRILFLEDLDEYLYHIDRMMLHLHRSGQLAGLAGLAVGHFSQMRDNATPFGSEAYQIIDHYARQYSLPVGYGFPIGHEPSNEALIVGQTMQLEVTPTGSRLSAVSS